ncbi:early nodulin-20-like [Panicum virgatum]|uniref:early nodulin-20-like n=1 Tax=Panicum virgatum TaxID=38727 RepID=UPI0019D63923|nr:early nodulin-20-like [Panicum virgatum]
MAFVPGWAAVLCIVPPGDKIVFLIPASRTTPPPPRPPSPRHSSAPASRPAPPPLGTRSPRSARAEGGAQFPCDRRGGASASPRNPQLHASPPWKEASLPSDGRGERERSQLTPVRLPHAAPNAAARFPL